MLPFEHIVSKIRHAEGGVPSRTHTFNVIVQFDSLITKWLKLG